MLHTASCADAAVVGSDVGAHFRAMYASRPMSAFERPRVDELFDTT